MCISVPAKVRSVSGNTAEVETADLKRTVLIAAEGVTEGSWVLIYAGIAVSVLDEDAAKETLQLLAGLQGDAKTA